MYGFRSLALGAALALGVAATASAQTAQDSAGRRHRDRGGMMARGERGDRLFKGITLTADQKTRVKAVREQYRTQFEALRGPKSEDSQRVRPDSAKRAQARDLMQREQADVRAVLTAEQQTQFDKNVTEMRANVDKRRADKGTGKAHGGHRRGKGSVGR